MHIAIYYAFAVMDTKVSHSIRNKLLISLVTECSNMCNTFFSARNHSETAKDNNSGASKFNFDFTKMNDKKFTRFHVSA